MLNRKQQNLLLQPNANAYKQSTDIHCVFTFLLSTAYFLRYILTTILILRIVTFSLHNNNFNQVPTK
jgi:hypothetical protein